MNSTEEVSYEVRVKEEPICYSQSISDTIEAKSSDNQQYKTGSNDKQSIKQEKRTREDISVGDQPNKIKRQSILANKVKEEPKSKSHILKVEEKFSTTEEFANKTSIAFLNEETTLEATTTDIQT